MLELSTLARMVQALPPPDATAASAAGDGTDGDKKPPSELKSFTAMGLRHTEKFLAMVIIALLVCRTLLCQTPPSQTPARPVPPAQQASRIDPKGIAEAGQRALAQ